MDRDLETPTPVSATAQQNSAANPLFTTASVSSLPHGNSALDPIYTVASVAFPATQDANVTKVGGATLSLGEKANASSLPVALSTEDLAALARAAAQTDGSQVTQVSSLPNSTYEVIPFTTSASGNATIRTPAVGKKVRAYYFHLNADGANSADVTAAFRFAAAGALFFKNSLKAGSIFARNVGAGRHYVEGAVNEALVVNLSAAQTVNGTVELEEV